MNDQLINNIVVEEVKTLLDEAAKTVEEVSKLALYKHFEDNEITYILYEPEAFYKMASGEAFDEGNDFPGYTVLGMIKVSSAYFNRCGGYIVSNSAAAKGYGPLMYDIAMSDISPNLLMSDREDVSSKASKVWNYMLTIRPNDYYIKKLTGQDTVCTQFNGEHLNYAFAIKKPLNFDVLERNHKKAIGHVTTLELNGTTSLELLAQLAQEFFDDKYHT